MGVRSWFRKQGRNIERGGKQAINAIEDTGKQAVKAVDSVADQSIDEIERLAKDVGGTIEREIMGVIDDVKDLANKAKREIESAANVATKEIEGVASTVKREIEEEGKKVLRSVEGEFEKIPDMAEDAVKSAIDHLAKAITSEGLKVIRDVVKSTKSMLDSERGLEYSDTLDMIGFNVQLGPVTLEYANFYTRADLITDCLDVWINEPPTFRRKPLLDLITALAPDSVDLGVDFEFAFGIGSDALGVGVGLSSFPTKLFILIGDDILKSLGVPE